MFRWLRRLRRASIRNKPFPPAWEEHLRRNLEHWGLLSGDEQQLLRELVQMFVAEKHWEGCGGLELDDEIRVTIAGHACLLLLGLEHDLYRNVESILVYPSTVVVPAGRHAAADNPSLVLDEPLPILGQAMHGGPVLLVWDDIRHAEVHPERGHNVVFHEFAHKLDMLDGSLDGTPLLAGREEYRRWNQVCTREYKALRAAMRDGRPSFLDDYAATNSAEFFAVATEVFFGRPAELQRKHTDLYAVLAAFYRQDPGGTGITRAECRRIGVAARRR